MTNTTRTPCALIVDDEADILELLSYTFSKLSIATDTAHSFEEACTLLQRKSYDVCLTDMRLPDGNGLDLVSFAQENSPDTAIAVITAHGSIETAIDALKRGAFDFLIKPVDIKKLRNLIRTGLGLHDSPRSLESHSLLIGETPAMMALRDLINKVARSLAPVYISGASGTGKELVARSIHQCSSRANQPFIPINCAAIPHELLESELFGLRKGSFTGASQDKKGVFQAADGGTLFLDEIADLPLSMQVKLLRAIQERAIKPIGDTKEIPVDIRIVCATHKNLSTLVQQGAFRQDLYYRINVIQIEVPDLKTRAQDIPLIAENFLTHLAMRHQKPKPSLSEDALALLLQYDFPGNVRELENILERSFALTDRSLITASDLKIAPATPHSAVTENSVSEKSQILAALEECRWNRSKTARKLGITLKALRYRLKKYEIE